MNTDEVKLITTKDISTTNCIHYNIIDNFIDLEDYLLSECSNSKQRKKLKSVLDFYRVKKEADSLQIIKEIVNRALNS